MKLQNNTKSNLILTKAYCESLLSVKKSNAEILRTIKLENEGLDLYDFKERDLYNNGKTIITNWKIEPTLYKSDNIETLFKQQINFKRTENFNIPENDILGRILITRFEESLYEGFCEDVSNGFIDEYDLPPIDTWFNLDFHNKELHSWVPEKFVKLMDEVIPCSSTDIYEWKE